MHLKDGTLLQGGRYRIVRFISSGGFGCTYEAEHIMLQKMVAIKEFFVIEGLSLADMLALKGILPEAKAVKYIRQAAEALAFVHQNNRLHLDIKPGNIMVNKDDEAVLIDFGTSKQYDEVDGENTSTLTGKSPGYAPPEQMDNSVGHFYPSTDIYALGATLYKLVSGITPLSATRLISGDELAPLPKATSQGVRNAIEAAMQMNKRKRPQSIKDFLSILDGEATPDSKSNVSEATELDMRKPKPQPQPKPTVSAPKGNSNSLWVVVVTVIVVGLIVGFSVRGCDKTDSHSWEAVDSTDMEAVDVPTYVTDEEMTYKGKAFTYTGDVNEDGQPDGKGRGVYEDGTYEGEYVNGCRQGETTFVTTGGEDKFEGTFSGDEYHEGTLTLVDDGSYFKGTFSANEPYTGTWYNKDGSVYCKLINGKMQ